MLTRGNSKLGKRHIWCFTLPSGTEAVCPGRTEVCSRYCYAQRLEKVRPKAHKAYRRNLMLTKRRDFVRRMYYFVRAMRIRTVRIHVGGDFYSEEYARKWLRIIQSTPRTRFYFYTRSWRVPSIRSVLESMAELTNCSAWYSCDHQTGIPQEGTKGIRIAWLQVEAAEVIPQQVDLVFRRQGLRQLSLSPLTSRVCPEQDGIVRSRPVTCERCRLCFQESAEVVDGERVLSQSHCKKSINQCP